MSGETLPTKSEIEQAMIRAEKDEAERTKAGFLLVILIMVGLGFKYQEELLGLRQPLEAALHQPLEVTILQVRTSGYKRFLDTHESMREACNGLLVASLAYRQQLSEKAATLFGPLKEPLLKFRTAVNEALADLDAPLLQLRKMLLTFEANYLKEPVSQLRVQILQSALFTDLLPEGSEWVLDYWLWYSGCALVFGIVFGGLARHFLRTARKHTEDILASSMKGVDNPITALFIAIFAGPVLAMVAAILALFESLLFLGLISTGLGVTVFVLGSEVASSLVVLLGYVCTFGVLPVLLVSGSVQLLLGATTKTKAAPPGDETEDAAKESEPDSEAGKNEEGGEAIPDLDRVLRSPRQPVDMADVRGEKDEGSFSCAARLCG
uniref:Uncharacterized protein n=1 Tax=Eutreptiella gymnastica TaxID=73025 RepID=A0A7S1NSC7_9EUGL